MTYRFHGLDNDLLNLKDVTKNLKVQSEHLRKKANVLESTILTIGSDHNSLEQCGQIILKLVEFQIVFPIVLQCKCRWGMQFKTLVKLLKSYIQALVRCAV